MSKSDINVTVEEFGEFLTMFDNFLDEQEICNEKTREVLMLITNQLKKQEERLASLEAFVSGGTGRKIQ